MRKNINAEQTPLFTTDNNNPLDPLPQHPDIVADETPVPVDHSRAGPRPVRSGGTLAAAATGGAIAT